MITKRCLKKASLLANHKNERKKIMYLKANLTLAVNLDEEIADALGIDEDTAFETYYENGHIVIRVLNEDDIEDFVCDEECELCPVHLEGCEDNCNRCACCGKCTERLVN